MDRVILSDESVNSYGFRVLTQGIDLSRFNSGNPVMLYEHQKSGALPIGKWEDYKVEGPQLSAVPVFDMQDDFAAKIAGKYERGYLNAASISIQILAVSEDPEDMLPGQYYPTVTACRLLEASLVAVPSNGNAVRLYDQSGQEVNLNSPEQLNLTFYPMENQKESTGKILQALSDIRADLSAFFGKKQKDKPAEAEAPAAEQPSPEQLSAQIDSLTAELTAQKQAAADLKAENQALQQKVEAAAELSKKIEQLEKEVTELGQAPATSDEVITPPIDQKGSNGSSDPFADLNARAAQKFSHFKKQARK